MGRPALLNEVLISSTLARAVREPTWQDVSRREQRPEYLAVGVSVQVRDDRDLRGSEPRGLLKEDGEYLARHNAAYASRGKTRRAQPPRGATPPSPHRSDLLLTTISELAIPPLIYILARHTLSALKTELHSLKT